MSTAAAPSRDALMPSQPSGMGMGLLLALLAHALLVAALAFSVRWTTSNPAGVEAELWAAVPQIAAPRAAAPEPTTAPPVVQPPPPPPKVEPAPAPKPVPAPEPVPDAQIAIEKAKREAAKKDEAKREQKLRDDAKREAALREQAKRDEARAKEELDLKAKKEEAAKRKAENDKVAAAREANLKRILGQAGASGEATSTGTAARTAGPSAGYAGRIRARIQPNIVFADSVSGNPMATVEVRTAPDGTIVGRRLVKSSGLKAWDDAVLRAIDKTEVLPRDTDGRVPPQFEIDFKPND